MTINLHSVAHAMLATLNGLTLVAALLHLTPTALDLVLAGDFLASLFIATLLGESGPTPPPTHAP